MLTLTYAGSIEAGSWWLKINHKGLVLKASWCKPLFSERNGYNKYSFRFWVANRDYKMKHWQKVIATWVQSTFGVAHQQSTLERGSRFLEEAIELAQAVGIRREMALNLLDKVYNGEPGSPKQEFGGAFVTLLALAENQGEVLLDCLITESNRIHQPEIIKKCQESQRRKKEQGLGI